jgi:hypothetical protein
VGEGARREGADDYRVSFEVVDDANDTAGNEHTDEDNHGSLARLYPIAAGEEPLIAQALFSHRRVFACHQFREESLKTL